MKKVLSLLLVGAMMVSTLPVAYATNTYNESNANEANTAVEYDASKDDTIGDNNGDGQPDNTEYYTVTVPATMAPGDTGYVVAKGTWASNRKLVVSLVPNPDTQKQTVTLKNSINAADTKELALTFNGITLVGSNTAAVTNITEAKPDGEAIAVAGITDALFGTWEGIFNYNVEMQDVA